MRSRWILDRIEWHAWSPYLQQLTCVFNDYAQPVLRQQGASRAAWRQELLLVQLCHQLRVKVHEHFPVECNCLWVWFRTSEMCFCEQLKSWALCVMSALITWRCPSCWELQAMPSRPVHQTESAFRTVSCSLGLKIVTFQSIADHTSQKKKRLADLIRFRAYLSSCTGTPHSWSWKAA